MPLRLGSAWLLQCVLWESAAAGIVFLLYNRWLILLVDGPAKTVALAAVGLACTAGAGWAALFASQISQKLPLFVLLVILLGEGRRLWLRHTYSSSSRIEANALQVPLTHPITTTDLVVTRYRIPTGSAMLRVRIVHLTDLHLNPKLPAAYYEHTLELVGREAPDIILLGGDNISSVENLALLSDWLPRLPSAPLGRYAVLGNHEYWSNTDERVRAALEEYGIKWMAGRCEVLATANDRHLVLCGTEEPWGPAVPSHVIDPRDYVILLSHTPDNVYTTSNQVDLMFAGHTHGGQWRLPWLGSLVVPSRFGRRLDRGHFKIERTHLLVSSGIGVDAPPVRVYCPPEIVVVDLE
jgi:predicted MPP superfamily phosphohydrolase